MAFQKFGMVQSTLEKGGWLGGWLCGKFPTKSLKNQRVWFCFFVAVMGAVWGMFFSFQEVSNSTH